MGGGSVPFLSICMCVRARVCACMRICILAQQQIKLGSGPHGKRLNGQIHSVKKNLKITFLAAVLFVKSRFGTRIECQTTLTLDVTFKTGQVKNADIRRMSLF